MPLPGAAHWPAARALLMVAALPALALAGCEPMGSSNNDRPDAARAFPRADRPVAPTISTRWASEDVRDSQHEAETVMDMAGVEPGMTVADLGAGEGYYTVRLAKRVGPQGRVLAEDIIAEVVEALGRRVTREDWDNVSVKLGTPEDPKLPDGSFDRVFMIHMYHEIAEPYAFLSHLYPALKRKGEVIVLESDRPIEGHGTPPELLRCEFASVGYVALSMVRRPESGGYLARFVPGASRPVDPDQIIPCALRRKPDEAKMRTTPSAVPPVAAPASGAG